MILSLMLLISIPDTWDFSNVRVNSDSVKDVHNEEQIVVNPTDSLNLVACWRDFRLGYRQVGIGYSFDGGETWEDYLIDADSTPFRWDSDPGLTTDAEGNIYLVVLSLISISDSNALAVLKSSDGGASFEFQGNAVMSDGTTFEDKELIACDRTDSEHRGNLYVAWAKFGGMGPQIYSVTSKDGGQTWNQPMLVGDQPGVQWPVPCVGADGTYYIAWVNYDPPSIKLDKSSDGGQSWGTDITVAEVYTAQTDIDGYIATFAFPAIDADITDGPYGGNLYVAYIDRLADYDIFFTRSADGGGTWSERIKISGEDEAGNDQFHPWLVVDNTGVIHVIFYDQRNGVAEGLLDVYYVYSEDGGDNWSEPIRVSDVSSKPRMYAALFDAAAPMPAGLIGEYIGLAAWNGKPFPVWTDFREDSEQRIYFGWLDPDTLPAVSERVDLDATGHAQATFTPDGLKISLCPQVSGTYHFQLSDVSGRELASTTRNLDASTQDISWDIGHLPRGVYFVRINGSGLSKTVKAVKLK